MTILNNKYYFEALDAYPYNLAECLEALNYALSFEPEDADALCLMGRLYHEQLRNFETAKLYFQEALQADLNSVSVPEFYIKCLLDNEDYDEAEKLIEFALKIKGIDKANILFYKSLLNEKRGDFKAALEMIAEAKKFCFNQGCTDFLKDREKFVKAKMPKVRTGSGKTRKKKETA